MKVLKFNPFEVRGKKTKKNPHNPIVSSFKWDKHIIPMET